MNNRFDIHREVFGRLQSRGRVNHSGPKVDTLAILELVQAALATRENYQVYGQNTGKMRAAAIDAAVAALQLLYSIDDAII